jgi:hypothetical protein
MNDVDVVSVYRGSGLRQRDAPSRREKHFVFDLDETLGSFSDLYLLYTCLDEINKEENSSMLVEPAVLIKDLLAIYPEFLRYGIATILNFLYYKKQQSVCGGVHVYTNNQCIPVTWTHFIIEFIEAQYHMPGLFGEIIRAFKINGEIVEHRRTTHAKTYSDLIQCILIPPKTELCFIDNVLFPQMKHRYLLYIQPKPYHHGLNRHTIIDRFLKSTLGQRWSGNVSFDMRLRMILWYDTRYHELDGPSKTLSETESDLLVSKKLMYHIREFFFLTAKTPKTRKYRSIHTKFTQKLRRRCVGNQL